MLRLAPAATRVWRSPDDLQLGVDPPLVVLRNVDVPTLRLLSRLDRGCERVHLDRVARAWAVPPGTVDALLDRLTPALVQDAPEDLLVPVVDGPPDLVGLLQGVAPGRVRPSLVVLAAHHVIPPAHHLPWLRSDVPHLPVVFGDAAAVVGPLVRPGATACLRCLDERRIDTDPAWPTLAAQLLRRGPAASALDAVTASAAARAARRAVLAGELDGVRRVEAGAVSALPAPGPHPRCSCRGLG